MSSCNHKDCNAPICPDALMSSETCWYSDEAICGKHRSNAVVQTQKKLAKFKAEGVFTLGMLLSIKRVRPNTAGANDDGCSIAEAVAQWRQTRKME